MAAVVPFPHSGEVFFDTRSPDRALRLSWHHTDGMVVLSLWRGAICTGTFRLSAADVPAVVESLVAGLGDGYSVPARHSAG